MSFDSLAVTIRPAEGAADLAAAARLLASAGLAPGGAAERTLVAEAGGEIVGTASLEGLVLQRIAVDPARREGDLAARLVTALVDLLLARGERTFFLYTPPASVDRFVPLGFRLLAQVDGDPGAALLEGGPRGLSDHLARAARPAPGERAGALVMNCNPMTLGHLHLVERAAARVDRLFLLLVSAERSSFPFAARRAVVERSVAHLPAVTVLPTGPWQVSPVTFPSYFSRTPESATDLQTRLDVTLFAERIAPALRATLRLAGSEPFCPVTARYNAAMREILPRRGIAFEEIPRLERDGAAVSASRVRALLASGDLAAALALVPPACAEYLRSPEGAEVAARLAANPDVH